jgi:ribosomal protein S12
MSKKKINFIAGEVKSIDVKTKTIVIKTEKDEKSVVCTDKTVMQSGKSKVTFDDIRKGDIAAVIYDVINGKNVAKNMTFHSTKGAPAAEQKAKP